MHEIASELPHFWCDENKEYRISHTRQFEFSVIISNHSIDILNCYNGTQLNCHNRWCDGFCCWRRRWTVCSPLCLFIRRTSWASAFWSNFWNYWKFHAGLDRPVSFGSTYHFNNQFNRFSVTLLTPKKIVSECKTIPPIFNNRLPTVFHVIFRSFSCDACEPFS